MTALEVVDTTAKVTGSEAVPVGSSSLVGLAASVGDIVAAQDAYHEVCTALLDENDVQVIGKKTFKKRSAWNKLAVAFAVSTEEVRTTHERDERGRIIRTECVVRATAPNGRTSDGIGACDRYERCCDPESCTKWLTYPDSGKATGHVHCSGFPCKQAHFSNPQHDIPATAFTRASNRAKADLFGMGEVSAEEIGEGAHLIENGDTAASAGKASKATKKSTPASQGAPKMASEAQMGFLRELCERKGVDMPEGELTMAQARAQIDKLKDGE